jgi:hypothetical protein
MRHFIAALFFIAFSTPLAHSQTTSPSTQPSLADLVDPSAQWEKLGTGLSWAEGPVWLGGDNGYLIMSDAHGQDMWKWSQAGGFVKFRTPSNASNGNTRDAEGGLSPPNNPPAASPAPRRTAPSPSWPTTTWASISPPPTTSSSGATTRSIFPIRRSTTPIKRRRSWMEITFSALIPRHAEVTIAVKGIRPNGLVLFAR